MLNILKFFSNKRRLERNPFNQKAALKNTQKIHKQILSFATLLL